MTNRDPHSPMGHSPIRPRPHPDAHASPTSLALAFLICTLALLTLPAASCSTTSASDPRPRATERRGVPDSAAAPALTPPSADPESVEPWTFNSKPGQMMTTEHYRVFTTEARDSLVTRLPLFMETALFHYRVALTGDSAPLPPPPIKLDTFILKSRPDWELLARQLLGDEAEPYLKIRRGGFAYAGRALLFDLGTYDTLAVTAHEGWHQYTQRTFDSSLPIWLEEGIATFMEGHRWAGRGSRPSFMPWANHERFDQLRRASARGRLLPLADLLSAAPQELISAGSSEPGLDYYAQVWALTHFLNEGENARYRPALRQAVSDAATGRLPRVVAQRLSARAAGPMALRRGPSVFAAYFNADLAEASAQYDSFVKTIVATGSRQMISAGQSPITAASPSAAPPAPAAAQ